MNIRLICIGLTLVGLSFSSGCSGDNTSTFEPLFTGLVTGTKDLQGCVSISNESVRIEFNDFDQQLSTYQAKGCKESSKSDVVTISVEAQLAGLWNNFVVLDEGTDVNGREIHLLDLNDAHKKYSLYYVHQPTFSDEHVSFYEPTEQEAKPDDCAEQAAEVDEWRKMNFPILIAQEKIFDSKTGKTRSTGSAACYPLQ